MLARSAFPTGLVTTVLTWLCGLFSKNRHCSTGDEQWGVEYSFLQTGLHSYLHYDIQQVAIVSWLMVAAWILPLFPDLTLVTHTMGLDALEFLHYWEDRMIKHLLVVGDWHRAGGAYYQSRQELLRCAGIPECNTFAS